MAHEMIHMSFHRRKGNKWAQHGKEFRARCHLVGKELGLDPLEL
jgi:predicted SprT family Zn-dependent metalloprotease